MFWETLVVYISFGQHYDIINSFYKTGTIRDIPLKVGDGFA